MMGALEVGGGGAGEGKNVEAGEEEGGAEVWGGRVRGVCVYGGCDVTDDGGWRGGVFLHGGGLGACLGFEKVFGGKGFGGTGKWGGC